MSDNILTVAQMDAARMISMGVSFKKIVEKVQVNRSTIYRWRRLPHFALEISRLTYSAKQESHKRMVRDITEIKDVILGTLLDVAQNDASGSARVSAARILNEMVMQAEANCDDHGVMQDQSEEILGMLQLIHEKNNNLNPS